MKTLTLAGLAALALLSGCGSGGLADSALQATGLRKPPVLPETQQPPRNVALRLHAAPKLNADKSGQALALAVRVYKLRRKEAFEATPYAAFLDPQAEKQSLGDDLLEVRELMLVPGQRYEVTEKVSREASHLALVALYQKPAAGRWRIVVPAADAERDGLTVGLHACALSTAGTAAALSSVRCQ